MSTKTRVATRTATKIGTIRIATARPRPIVRLRTPEELQREFRDRIYATQHHCPHPRPKVAC